MYILITGCDYNPTFFRKAKLRPYQLLIKNKKYIEAFKNVCSVEKSDSTFLIIEEFVCEMYGLKRMQSVNEARTALFKKNINQLKINL